LGQDEAKAQNATSSVILLSIYGFAS